MDPTQLICLAVSALLGYADSHRGTLHLPLDLAQRWSPVGWSPVESGAANPHKIAQITSTTDGMIDSLIELSGYLQFLVLKSSNSSFEGAMQFFETHRGYGKDIYHAFAKYARLEAAEARKPA